MKKSLISVSVVLMTITLLSCALLALLASCGAPTADCEHSFDSYMIVDATCTTAGTKTGVCTKCKTEVTIETYPALGHTDIHGKCSRCQTEVNNVFVAVSRDEPFLSQAKTYLDNASDDVEYARIVLSNDVNSIMKTDSYIESALSYVEKAVTVAEIGKSNWEKTREHKAIATKYKAIIKEYDSFMDSDDYKEWKKTGFYLSGAKSTRNMALLELSLSIIDMEYDFDLVQSALDSLKDTSEYWADKDKKEITIAYQGEFKVATDSDLTIVFDSFNPDALTTTYLVKVTDGEHTYTAPARDVYSSKSVTIKNCVLNAGATVTLSFEKEDHTAVASFSLLAEDPKSVVSDNGGKATGNDNDANGGNTATSNVPASYYGVYEFDRTLSDAAMVSEIGDAEYTLELSASGAVTSMETAKGVVNEEFTCEYNAEENAILMTIAEYDQPIKAQINGSVLTMEGSGIVFRRRSA